MSLPITITMPKEYFERNFRLTTTGRAIRLDDLTEFLVLKESRGYVRLGREAAGTAPKENQND